MIKYVIFSCSNPQAPFSPQDMEYGSKWEICDIFSDLDEAKEKLKVLRGFVKSDGFVLLKREYQVLEA